MHGVEHAKGDPVNNILHFVCMECKREYRTLRVERDLGTNDKSHGYCPDCAPRLLARVNGLFGVRTQPANSPTLREVNMRRGFFDVEENR